MTSSKAPVLGRPRLAVVGRRGEVADAVKEALRSRVHAIAWALVLALATCAHAAGHRDAPLTALDPAADITDVFAFRSYDPGPPRVTLIMNVNPFLEPTSGALGTPFDPEILYEIHVDNDDDAVADLTLQFRFTTEIRAPGYTAAIFGAGGGVTAPANSPPPIAAGAAVVSPQIATFDDVGLGIRQSYTVTLVQGRKKTPLGTGIPLYAVPGNLGPRTMNAAALFAAGIHDLGGGVRVFAGTTDDPFYADLAALTDTLNIRAAIAPGVLTPADDAANVNIASDTLAGFAVNSIAIEVPVEMLTASAAVEASTAPAATIGVWATTSRFAATKRPPPKKPAKNPRFKQVQRTANPFVNDWLVPLAAKDAFSRALPENDAAFAPFFSDPQPARIWNALTGGALGIPTPPRDDLAVLISYAPPIAAPGTPAGPTADLLRLNTGVPPTPLASTSLSRLGLLGGDPAGFPNGRRLFDDVTDIMLRVVNGVFASGFDKFPNNRLGDGVNVNDVPYRTSFPYLANAPSGRDRRHIDPGEPGCTGGAGSSCVP